MCEAMQKEHILEECIKSIDKSIHSCGKTPENIKKWQDRLLRYLNIDTLQDSKEVIVTDPLKNFHYASKSCVVPNSKNYNKNTSGISEESFRIIAKDWYHESVDSCLFYLNVHYIAERMLPEDQLLLMSYYILLNLYQGKDTAYFDLYSGAEKNSRPYATQQALKWFAKAYNIQRHGIPKDTSRNIITSYKLDRIGLGNLHHFIGLEIRKFIEYSRRSLEKIKERKEKSTELVTIFQYIAIYLSLIPFSEQERSFEEDFFNDLLDYIVEDFEYSAGSKLVYKSMPNNNEFFSCTIYFLLNIIKMIKEIFDEPNAMMDKFPARKLEKLMEFIFLCWQEDNGIGAFSPNIEREMTLTHSTFALKSFQIIDELTENAFQKKWIDFVKDGKKGRKLYNFVKKCSLRGESCCSILIGAHPSLYATQSALVMKKFFMEYNKEYANLFGTNLDFLDDKIIVKDIQGCFNPGNGGVRGYIIEDNESKHLQALYKLKAIGGDDRFPGQMKVTDNIKKSEEVRVEKSFEDAILFYEKNINKWKKTKQGKYVALHGNRVLGWAETYDETIEKYYKEENAPVYIEKVPKGFGKDIEVSLSNSSDLLFPR